MQGLMLSICHILYYYIINILQWL